MKKLLLIPACLVIISVSCKKENCKEKQKQDLQMNSDQMARELSNQNLTLEQKQAIAAKYAEKEKAILAECQ